MTNKEAIEILKSFRLIGEAKEAFQLAISALEQQPEPERWRDAEWPRDASNPPKEARFSRTKKEWHPGPLTGFCVGEWYSQAMGWNYCQVRDE